MIRALQYTLVLKLVILDRHPNKIYRVCVSHKYTKNAPCITFAIWD